MDEYLEVNRRMWDERAPVHAASPGYQLERLLADPLALSEVVAFDLPRLGRLDGLDVVHLQCHIGTDTLSLARLGARSVAGLDFSAPAIAEARGLAARAGTEIAYVQADAYDAPEVLGAHRFDLVYTGVGALCWLSSIGRWAEVVRRLLRPGGRVFLREGHPVMNAIDERRADGALALEFAYFEQPDPLRWEDDEAGTYVETDAALRENVSYEWNRGLGEIVTALLARGFRLTQLEEHETLPWEAFTGGRMEKLTDGEHRLLDRPERLPLSYTLEAVLEERG